jgi:RHS repeat-associated protein
MTAATAAWRRAVAVLEARRAADVSPATGRRAPQGTARAATRGLSTGHPLLLRTAWALVALLALGLPSRADAQAADTPNFTIEYHHADLSGNIRLTTDEYGAVVREAIHLPFGERDTGECGTLEDGARPLGYQGKPRDPKTCLDDFGARDYRAAIGRFQTVDPVLPVDRALRDPQQWNRYAYARNNPLIYSDPDGREIAVIHGGRLYGGGFSGQAVNTTTYGVVTPVHGLGAVAAGSTVVAAGRMFIAGVMSAGLSKLVPWLSGPQGQEAMTTAAEVLTGQELGPGGVPAGRVGGAKEATDDAIQLAKQLASEETASELLHGGGRAMAGAGSRRQIDDIARLVATYGGDAGDWAKITSASRRISNGVIIETHAYKNIVTGVVYEIKTKLGPWK